MNLVFYSLIPLGVIALYSLNLVVRFLHYYSIRIVVINVNQKVREKLFSHLIHLSSDYFRVQKSGVLLSRITADPQNLDSWNCFIQCFDPWTHYFSRPSGLHDVQQLAISDFNFYCTFTGLALLLTLSGKYIKRKIAHYQEKNGESYSTLQETISGIRIIHLSIWNLFRSNALLLRCQKFLNSF